MATYPRQIQVTEIATWLKQQQHVDRSTILFLGSRCGSLFRCKSLYETLEKYSTRKFPLLPIREQFAECYQVLQRNGFTKSDIELLLEDVVKNVPVSPHDEYLAQLVKDGVFDIVISANLDNLLEDAYRRVGMEEKRDFYTFSPQRDTADEIKYHVKKPSSLLIHLFGEIKTHDYDMKRQHWYFDAHPKWKEALRMYGKNAVVMVGDDEHWDSIVPEIFPDDGEEFWYINEEKNENSDLWRILEKRKGGYLVGDGWTYEHFMYELWWRLCRTSESMKAIVKEDVRREVLAPLGEEERETVKYSNGGKNQKDGIENGKRKKIFIASNKKDDKYLKELKVHIEVCEKNGLEIWDDSKIVPGQNWHEEMQKALDTTKVAILLISRDFLNSLFIKNHILPPLLKAAEAGGATILPVFVRHCFFEDSGLMQFKPFNEPDKPIVRRGVNRDALWADLTRQLIKVLSEE